MTDEQPQRTPTPIDAIAEDWVRTLVDLDPGWATYIGVEGRLGEYGDYSPAGHEAHLAAVQHVIRRLEAAEPVDDVDRVTRTDLLSELRLEVEGFDAKLQERDINVIASPAQEIRDVFDLMPRATIGDWSIIAQKLQNVPGAVTGYVETLRAGIQDGVVPARRQVAEVAGQAHQHADPVSGFFATLASGAALDEGGALPESLRDDLAAGARAAEEAYAQLAAFLEGDLAPRATTHDAVGREIYALRSRHFLGAVVDLDETYEWGVAELARMVEEQTRIAGEIQPGASVAEAIVALDRDPARKLNGTDALLTGCSSSPTAP